MPNGLGIFGNPGGAAVGNIPQLRGGPVTPGELTSWLPESLPMEGRPTFVPWMNGGPALPGIAAGMYNAFTAPGRALQGQQLGPEEALNVAGMVMGGGGIVPKPGAGGVGMNVFHGSPHKFDKFDMSKIGTGEGAQAYGHGLYFAENPKVAMGYQEKLANPLTSPETAALDFVTQLGGDRQKAIASMRDQARGGLGYNPQESFNLRKGAELLESGVDVSKAPKPGGHLYKTDLPDEAIARMLDWDKRFGDQPPNVQRTLEQIFGSRPPDQAAISSIYRGIADKHAAQVPGMPAGVTQPNPAMASELLKQAGIPGIRYLDQGSRAGGAGTSNFSVFDDTLLKILERR